jgi:hypothetical protein
MKSLLALCLVLFVSYALAKELPHKAARAAKRATPTRYVLDPARLPLNIAVVEGSSVELSCAVQGPSTAHSIQWIEYAYNPNGAPISDNEFIGSHPEAARYTILHRDEFEYTLQINPVVLGDGGIYQCQDAQASPVDKRQHSASLTVVATAPNCTSTIRASGVVIDGAYTTNDCTLVYNGGIIPNMTWSGIAPFNPAYVSTPTSVWAGMAFNATRAMDTAAHQCTTYFTGYFLPVPANTATNVPTFTSTFQGPQMFIQWGPTAMAASPIRTRYDAGENLTCTADAFPQATFIWQNLRTNQVFVGPVVRIDESWRGFNQSMRCEAKNTIEGTIYSQNIFLPVDVNPLTTTPVPTTPTTTTEVPAVSPCNDLTGPWLSTTPTAASLCIRLDLANNGALTGLLKNASDTYWVDIVGRAQSNKFDQVGFNGIWPADIGVSSFIGECHRCFGEERLLVNVVSRSRGSPCGTPGPVFYTTQYVFHRAVGELQCPNIPPSY